MSLRQRIAAWIAGPQPVPVAAPEQPRKPFVVSPEMVARSRVSPPKPEPEKVNPFKIQPPPSGVLPDNSMAMDESALPAQSWAIQQASAGLYYEGMAWLGFPHLSELAQRPEYRRISEIIATEATRQWIRVTAAGEVDKADKIKAISDKLQELAVKELFQKITEQDGFFGRAHLFVDLGQTEGQELATPIGNGSDKATKAKVGRDSLKGLRTVEAVWCYPAEYETSNPLKPNWYKPSAWYVQGQKVHATRLLTFIAREVPDLLKPAYSFGGLSMSQMAKPYVDNWLRTRQSVADLISSFSVSGIKIDLANALQVDEDGLFRRVELFNNLRDNRGTMVLNKGTGPADPAEEFFNVSTPLGTLDHLQAQSQEHICSVAGIPLVKFTGITPSGLNASSEGEIRVYYDGIEALQEKFIRPHLTTVINLIQMSEFGAVDPDIGFVFEPLWSLDDKAKAEKRKAEADTDAIYIDAGVLDPLEVRQRLASDDESPYAGLDVDDVPLPPPGENEDPPEPEKDEEETEEAKA